MHVKSLYFFSLLSNLFDPILFCQICSIIICQSDCLFEKNNHLEHIQTYIRLQLNILFLIVAKVNRRTRFRSVSEQKIIRIRDVTTVLKDFSFYLSKDSSCEKGVFKKIFFRTHWHNITENLKKKLVIFHEIVSTEIRIPFWT
jgi:hypothetical protein